MLTTKYSMFMSVRVIATERTLRGYFSDVKSNLKKNFLTRSRRIETHYSTVLA